jgi:cation diffusion facilitator CzcD-associated flavoprotein CzcO
VYRFSWDKELLQSHPWPNNYLHQPEVLAYFQEVARKHDLYPLIQFQTELTGAVWDEERNVWRAKASTRETFVVGYLVTALGILHHKNVPDFPGLGEFKGTVVHSSALGSEH